MLGTSLSAMGQVLPALASQSTKVVAIPLENQTYDDIRSIRPWPMAAIPITWR